MRKALLICLEKHDLSTFLQNVVVSRSRNFNKQSLFKMRSVLYCHCKMPADGNLTVECVKCKSWFHRSCEVRPFESNLWTCMTCSESEMVEEKLKLSSKDKLAKLVQVARKELQKTIRIQQLYDAIKYVIQADVDLPNSSSAIGFASYEAMSNAFLELKIQSNLYGFAFPLPAIKTFYICIFSTCCSSVQILETVIHEMAHGLHFLAGKHRTCHGIECKNFRTFILNNLRSNFLYLSSPFCDLKVT